MSDKKRIGESRFLESNLHNESVNLRLLCKNESASYLFDRFGVDVIVLANAEDEFEASVKTEVNGALLSWIFLSEGKIRILSPSWAADKYNELIKKSSIDQR